MDLKARHLIFALLGNARLGPESPVIAASTFVTVLGQLGVAKSAVRAALNRMVDSQQLTAHHSGRTVAYRITPALRSVLEDARQRLFRAEPFATPGPGWTVVTLSVPEARRTHRYHVGALLTWRGFAPLWNGLWIAPGAADAQELISEVGSGADGSQIMVFHATTEHPRLDVERAVELWGLAELGALHETFIDRWSGPLPGEVSPLGLHTWLIAEWTRLIRRDPRLPDQYLPPSWPSRRSYEVFLQVQGQLFPDAREEFNSMEPAHRPLTDR